MKSRLNSFESELSTQIGLSEHLALRALDAFEAGDKDAFRYASEIHDETQKRIIDVNNAKIGVYLSFVEYRLGRCDIESPIGTLALASMVLNRELEVA